jgi:hypothetical protein
MKQSQDYYSRNYLEETIKIYIKNREILKFLKSNVSHEYTAGTLNAKDWYEKMIKKDMLDFGATRMIYSKPWHIFLDNKENIVLTRYMSYYIKHE